MGGAHVSATTLSLTIVWAVLCRSSNGQHCGHPGKPRFSKFDFNDFYEAGDKVNYECLNGYQLYSLSKSSSEFALSGQRECLPNGTWSHGDIRCYKPFRTQDISCSWNRQRVLYECSTGKKLDRASEFLLFSSPNNQDISGFNVSSCGKIWEKFSYHTSSILFRFPTNGNSNTCTPLDKLMIEISINKWSGTYVTAYERNGLCGTPETPANGRLIRLNMTTVQHVCNIGYRLEGNEYRYCIDSIWDGTQVVCNKTTDEYESIITSSKNGLCDTPETPANGRLIRLNMTTVQHVCNIGYRLEGNEYRNCIDSIWDGTQVVCNKTTDKYDSSQSNHGSRMLDVGSFSISLVAIAISVLTLLILIGVVFFICSKRNRRRNPQISERAPSVIYMDTGIGAAGSTEPATYAEILVNSALHANNIYERVDESSPSQLVEALYAQPTKKNQRNK